MLFRHIVSARMNLPEHCFNAFLKRAYQQRRTANAEALKPSRKIEYEN